MKYLIKNNKIKKINISGIIIKGVIDKNSINKERRLFSGFGSAQIVDRQGDYLPIEEFKPVMEKLMQRGAPVTDSHSNHVVGKIVDYTYKPTPTGEMGLYLTAEIYNHYPTDAETWRKIQEGEYTGFSLGGKAGTKTPTCTNIGCYNILGNIEAWEFSIVERPANQLANIDKVNKLAKASDISKYYITKDRIYINNPIDAPQGVRVQEGERGGLYYESTSSQELPSQDNIDFYEDDGILQIRHNNNFIGEIDYLPILEGIGKIKSINIKSEARGQGWGKKLLDKLEEKFQNNGAKKIVTSSVTPKAEEFWNKMGYKQIENTRNWSKELIELKPITKTN